MKKRIQFFFVAQLLLATAATSLQGQSRTVPVNTVIFIDQSDASHLEELRKYAPQEIKAIVASLHGRGSFKESRQARVTVVPMNEVGENRPLTVKSPTVTEGMTDTQVKRKVLAPFTKAFAQVFLQSTRGSGKDLGKTKIFEPLCRYLTKASKSGRKLTVIVYSDGLENSKVSFYRRGRTLPVEPTLKSLEGSCGCELPSDLSFLDIHFVSFRTEDNDQLVSAAQEFWEKAFSGRGAKAKTGSGY